MLPGRLADEQLGPELPDDATYTMPAFVSASTESRRMLTSVQPSDGGQPHELLITCGALVGSGVPPATGVGASMNSWHSMYVAGEPSPTFMLRQPIHCAP